MVRVLLAAVVLGSIGVLALSLVNASPLEIEREGRTVKVRGEHMAARFSSAGRLSGEFMVFGAGEQPSDIESAWLLTVTAADGRWLLDEYPDLRRCGSAGADHFKRIAEGMYLIGANGFAHRVLGKAATLQAEREREGGARLCIRMAGERVELEYAGWPEAGRDLTEELQRVRRDTPYFLIDRAELVDCG